MIDVARGQVGQAARQEIAVEAAGFFEERAYHACAAR